MHLKCKIVLWRYVAEIAETGVKPSATRFVYAEKLIIDAQLLNCHRLVIGAVERGGGAPRNTIIGSDFATKGNWRRRERLCERENRHHRSHAICE